MRIEARPESEAARIVLAIYSDVLDAVRADVLVSRTITLDGNWLQIDGQSIDLSLFDRILVIGAGKAATGMAQAVETLLGDRVTDGIVVTKYGHGGPTRRIRILEAAHPTPDESSVEAGRAIAAMAAAATERDLVICLLSGGGSSLMELPREPLVLEDLRATTDQLLHAGAPIQDLNAVRSNLSQLKSGGLARIASPATILTLVLSDVLGNSLAVIGSGPCVDACPDPHLALDILRRYDLVNRAPVAIVKLLEGMKASPTQTAKVNTLHFIVGDIWAALNAARHSAERLGLRPIVLTGWLEGEAREVGRFVGAMARDLPITALETGSDCLILGGETTVAVRGTGIGGRSQEIACAALKSLADVEDVAVLAGSTDGTDGPTDAAGGVAERAVYNRATDLGLDIHAALRDNDAYHFLESAGGLIRTGPAHSNVGDVVIVTYREA